jgi:hypothetical protein
MMIATRSVLIAAVCGLGAGRALAGPVLTFEGLKPDEPVWNYYDAGLGGKGSGPGPDFGIRFSASAQAEVRTSPFPNDPSSPTVLVLKDLGRGPGQPAKMTMDVTGGFTHELSFYDIAIGRTASVQLWSDLDGSGTLLAQQTLPLLLPSHEVFTGPLTVPFAGTAHSVIFQGGNRQLVCDNIRFAVPEPSAWLSLVTGLGCSYLAFAGWRRKAAAR